MKVLVVIPLVYGGGAEQVAAILSREWVKGHQVRVVTYHIGPDQLDFGVPVESLNLPARQGLWARLKTAWARVKAVRKIAREFQPDVVMAFMDEAGMVCSLAGLCDGWLKRLIVSVHHNPQWLRPARRALLAGFYRLPVKVVAVSQGVHDELHRALRLPIKSLAHIPNPLVLRSDEGEAESRARLAQLPAQFILFVGRMDWHAKGFDVLLAAYAGLPAGRLPLVIVGDGPDRRRIEEEIARRGLQHDVVLVGWVRDPQPFYRHASVFVMSSRFEGWSNVLMEAMGQGCLVAGTRCPYGPPEILGPQLQHLLVPVGDAQALCTLLQTLLSQDAPTRIALQSALQARANTFAAPIVAKKWLVLAHDTIRGMT
jgi:glycosyltransferase involved in cell wall biosynthesis